MTLVTSGTGIQHRLTSTQDNCLGSCRLRVPSRHNFVGGAHSAPIDAGPKHHKVGSEPEMDRNTLLGSSGLFHHLHRPEHGGLYLRGHRSEKHHQSDNASDRSAFRLSCLRDFP